MSDIEHTFWRSFDSTRVQVIGIGVGENTTIARQFVSNFGLTYPVLHDRFQSAYSDYFVIGESPFPRDAIIDRSGTVRYLHSEYDPQYMTAVINDLLLTGVEPPENGHAIPKAFALKAFPNPFNPTTTLTFTAFESGKYSIRIFDLRGREVQNLPQRFLRAGEQARYSMDFSGLSSGVYIASVSGQSQSTRIKLVLMK